MLGSEYAVAKNKDLPAPQILNAVQSHVEGVPFSELFKQIQNQSHPGLSGLNNLEASEVFRRYVRARIRQVPLFHRQHVEQALQIENMTLEYVNPKDRQTSETIVHGELNQFEGAVGKIMLRLPIELENTFLDHAIRVHELEHLIQFLHLDGHTVAHERPEHVDFVFEAERGAMLAEAVYLLAIPRDLLLTGFETIDSIPRLSESDKNFLKGMVRGALESKTPGQYVQHQWQIQGRYTRDYIRARLARERVASANACEGLLGSLVRIWNDLF